MPHGDKQDPTSSKEKTMCGFFVLSEGLTKLPVHGAPAARAWDYVLFETNPSRGLFTRDFNEILRQKGVKAACTEGVDVQSALRSGQTVIALTKSMSQTIDGKASEPDSANLKHFLLLSDYNKKENGNESFKVYDPLTGDTQDKAMSKNEKVISIASTLHLKEKQISRLYAVQNGVVLLKSDIPGEVSKEAYEGLAATGTIPLKDIKTPEPSCVIL